MSLPRSTAQTAAPYSAVANFTFANATFTAVTANATVVSTFNLPRSFKPQKAIQIVLPSALPSGLTMGNPYITGNAPSCSGCSPSNYVLNIPFTNSTAGSLTPTSQTMRVVQD